MSEERKVSVNPTIHLIQEYDEDAARRFLHIDSLIAVGLVLDAAGHSDAGARLIATFGPETRLISDSKIIARAAGCMAKAHRVIEALHLADRLLQSSEFRFAVRALLVSALAKSRTMSPEELDVLQGFLSKYVQMEEAGGDPLASAAANYNFGNHMRGRGAFREALRLYVRASKFDSTYVRRGYFCRELAGILFSLRRCKLAAKFYKTAIELGEKMFTRALYADCLMFLGQYSDAIREFDVYIAEDPDAKAEFRLKSWALKGMQRVIDSHAQSRKPTRALFLATRQPQQSDSEFHEKLRQALQEDALCGLAWFNLGVLWACEENNDEACIAFLAAALVQNQDIEAWANAFALAAFSRTHNYVAPEIASAAYFLHGDSFVEKLVENARQQCNGFPRVEYLAAIDRILNELPKVKQSFELRLIDERGTITRIVAS